MPHLADDKKWAIIHSLKHSRNVSMVARQHGVTRRTVQLWAKRFKDTGRLQNLKPGGRRPAMSTAAAKAAVVLLCSNAHAGATGVAKELCLQGLTSTIVHRTTVVRHAKKAAIADGTPIKSVRGKPAKRLSNDTKSKRLAFCLANRSKNWANVLFTDRKKFHFTYPGVSVKPHQWVQKGTVVEASAVNHAQTVNVYAGISRFGVTECHIVAGTSKHKSTFFNKQGKQAKNITSQEYEMVLKATLLPGGKRIFSTQGVGSWVLQQDNDPTHRVANAVVHQWNQQQSASITILPNWPPNSPDLNLIENVWSYVQAKVNARGCKTFEQFMATVLFEMQHIPKSMLANLFDSMPKRVAQVIETHGEKTKY